MADSATSTTTTITRRIIHTPETPLTDSELMERLREQKYNQDAKFKDLENTICKCSIFLGILIIGCSAFIVHKR
jgi:hypothetical protein